MRARIYQIESLSSAESTVCCFFFFCPLRRSRWWCNAYASFAVCVHQTVTHTNKPFFTAHWSYSQVLAAAGMGLSLSPSLFPAFFNQKTTGGQSSPQSSPPFFSLFVFGYTQVCFCVCVCVVIVHVCVCVFSVSFGSHPVGSCPFLLAAVSAAVTKRSCTPPITWTTTNEECQCICLSYLSYVLVTFLCL